MLPLFRIPSSSNAQKCERYDVDDELSLRMSITSLIQRHCDISSTIFEDGLF